MSNFKKIEHYTIGDYPGFHPTSAGTINDRDAFTGKAAVVHGKFETGECGRLLVRNHEGQLAVTLFAEVQ